MKQQDLLDQVRQVGRQAALAAGALLKLNYEKPHDITMKSAIDPVTESDFAAQKTIISLIRQTFPDHGILAEEKMESEVGEGESHGLEARATGRDSASRETSPTYRWIIDPLDGTVNFAHGFPMFCVSIGFEAAGVMEYGVVYEPLRDELFEAVRGEGAWLNRSKRLKVSGVDRLNEALVATGFPYDIRERLPATLDRMGRVLAASQGLRRAGSAALDLAYVAAGRMDAFFEENLKPWDTAAGILLVMEAGGMVSTFTGEPYTLFSDNIAASNGLLHRDIVGLLTSS